MGTMSFWRGFARPARYAALVCGALPALAFPSPNLEFLAWVGLVPGFALMRAAPSAREAAARGWWFGTGLMLAAQYWLAPNIGPGLLLAGAVFGALWTGVGVSVWALLRPPVTAARALAALAVVPSYWLLTGWIRSWQGFGGPWALLGASQWQHPEVLALAAVGGVWLISFVLVAVNVGLVILVTAGRARVRALGALVVAVLAVSGPAAFALVPAPRPDRQVTVALVQPGIVHNPRLRADASERLSAGLAAHHPDLVVWGESSVAADLRKAPRLLRRIEALSAADRAQILVNQDSVGPRGKSKVAVLVGPQGIDGAYTKTRLVPFGEYIPFRQQLGWLTRISRAAPVNMIPGDGAHVLRVRAPGTRPLTIGPLICFEIAFPDMSRVDTRHGARLLVYQTSDSTFQRSWAPAQQASLAALRAAETGRPAVQAALTGVTAAFDARGRQLTWMGTSDRGVAFVRLSLPPATSLTPFDRFGEFVPWTAVGITIVAATIALLGVRRRHRRVEILLDGNRRSAPSVSISEASPGAAKRAGGANGAPSSSAADR